MKARLLSYLPSLVQFEKLNIRYFVVKFILSIPMCKTSKSRDFVIKLCDAFFRYREVMSFIDLIEIDLL